MKKVLALGLSLSLATVMFAGCGSDNDSSSSKSDAGAKATTGSLKTGLAVISKTDKSKDVSDKDGIAQIDSTIVAVTVDKDGKIVECVIDAAQTKINFDATGKLKTDLKTEFKTKDELGKDYGMVKASKIGKEWYEQSAAFAKYVTGKTVDEVKGIKLSDDGKVTDTDLATSVTVSVGAYIEAIEKAVKNSKELGAKAGDKLGLGIVTNIAKSTDAGEKDGVAQAYSNYGVVTIDKAGKITSATIDASQTNVNFSKAGKITSDLTAQNMTKDELGDKYGMKKASSIGKEWYEQAAAFSKYVTGKTLDEVKGIKIENGKATDTDLKASVTVGIADYIAVISKAVGTAK